MRYVAAVILLTCALQLSGQVLVRDSINHVDANGWRQGYWVFTGAMKNDRSYQPEAIVEEGHYIDNRKDGYWVQYYPSGVKKSELYYVANRPNGFATLYYENGNVKETGTWVGTRWVGIFKRYYENGVLCDSCYFNSLGQRHGERKVFSDQGVLTRVCNYSNGKENGWAHEYYSNGLIKKDEYYIHGLIDPSKTKLYPEHEPLSDHSRDPGYIPPPKPPVNDTTCKDCEWKNGVLVSGKQYVYNENGLLIRIKVYKNGKYVGDAPFPE